MSNSSSSSRGNNFSPSYSINTATMESGAMRRNSTLICVPLMADSVDQMVIDMSKAKAAGGDLVEIRLDCLKNFRPRVDLETLIKECPLPTLITYRPKWEGGQYEGDENKRLDALRLAMELGADYVDVELKVASEFSNSIDGKKPDKFKLIISSHNYQNTPSVEELGNLVANIQAAGADIVKIATTALDITDVARMFQITVHSQVPVIGLVMGERGLMSRILCTKFGGYLTFGTLEAGKVSAPGQPTIEDLLNLYNFRLLGLDTKVFGIIGKPVSHSMSPILYNEAFKSVGFDGVYSHLLVDDVARFFETYSSTDFAGFSYNLMFRCTIPHKEAVLKCCDEVDPVAESIGAVNCIIRKLNDGKLFGCNTDYVGAISAIENGLRGLAKFDATTDSPLANRLFVVIGAGGAGKALAYVAKAKGARVVIANHTYNRARELASIVGGDAISLDDLGSFHPEDCMILANTTSIGMHPDVEETPVPKVSDTQQQQQEEKAQELKRKRKLSAAKASETKRVRKEALLKQFEHDMSILHQKYEAQKREMHMKARLEVLYLMEERLKSQLILNQLKKQHCVQNQASIENVKLEKVKLEERRKLQLYLMEERRKSQLILNQLKKQHCVQNQASIENVKLEKVKLEGVKLEKVKPGEVKLEDVKLEGVKLEKVKPGEVKLEDVKFEIA